MKRWTSLLLTAALVLSMVPSGFAAGGDATADTPPDKIGDATVWRYLDDNTDPAGDDSTAADYDRTSWTATVETHNESADSSDIWLSMPTGLTVSTDAPADRKVLIDESTQWKYLDDGTDPAGDSSQTNYDRYSWTGSDYNDSKWKTGKGPFGAYLGQPEHSDGNPVTTLLNGTKEESHKEESTPTYFFRTTVELTEEDLAGMNRIQGHVVFDDAVIVYINGQEVAQHFTIHYNENVAFGSERGKDDVLEGDILCTEPASLLHAGENIIAVELHQDINSTERSYLKMDLALSGEELSLEQKDIGLYVGSDESEMNFSWYSNSREPGQVQIAEKSALESDTLPEDATVVSAQAMTAYQPGFYSYQATVSGLKPNTTYSYQLTNGELASAVYEFTTARSEGFSFAFAADPQLKTQDHEESWDNTLDIVASNEKFKHTSFLLVAGDQVNDNHEEEEYDWYLSNDVLPGLPQATLIGNHDSGCRSFEMHYNLPNESQEYGTNSSGSSDYYFVYNNVLFLMLNSQNTEYEQHAAFMREAIEKTKNMNIQWKVVAFHHSIFSVAEHALEEITEERRSAFAPLFKELDIDVVFMGHDHSYTRTYMMDGVEIASGENYSYDKGEENAPTAVTDPNGILYITGNCASTRKFYDIQDVDFPFSAVQNQDYKPNISRVDVTNDSFTVTTYCTEDMSVVDSFTIKRDGGDEGTYTPAPTNDTRVTGYYDATGSLKLTLAGRYDSQAMNADGGSLEIVQYNAKNGFAYAVSGVKGKLIAVDLNGKLDGDKVVSLTGKEYDVKGMVSSYGDMTSVAISPDGTRLAVAIQSANYDDQGSVALFACNDDGSLEALSTVKVGVQPDMLTFVDGSTLLTADEGEPRQGTNGEDPKGSVTIVTIDPDTAKMTANSVYFDKFDAQRAELTAAGILIQKGYQPSTDFEPEYIAVNGRTAYVALQEANAIAVLDIDKAQFTGVYPLGLQDYSQTKVDLQKDKKIDLTNYENVYGIKMPDGISVTTVGGKTYLLTANEGDSRADWANLNNEVESTDSPTGNVKLDEDVVWFNATMWDGLDQSKAYVFGGRSFSLYEVTDAGLKLVYDSGSDFEEITAKQLPKYFNCSNDKIKLDNRSGKKGPEPESVVTGAVNGKTYAFVALERIGGVMVYDISDPANTAFVNYINSRDFSKAVANDVSPEGLCFVSAADSKTGSPLLLAACEVSGTMAAYELTPVSGSNGGGSHSGGGSSSGGGSGSVTYPVTVPTTDGGTVTVSPKSAARGETVTVTVKPDAGCTLDQIAAKDRNGNALTLTDKGNGVYTFTQPAGAVTLTVRFAAEGAHFTDVPADAWYAKAVAWAVEQGVTDGIAADRFAPDGSCTRAQIVTFLWRAAGSPAPKAASSFTDVPADAWYADAVAWAVEQGITKGLTDTTFGPDVTCTRAQGVTFLWRLEKAPAAEAANGAFSDVADGAWYADAVAWAVAQGVTDGTSQTTFSPDGTCTRAQIVTFLWRALAA